MRYLTPKYVAVLALIAAGILVIGSYLRPDKKQRNVPPPDTTATPLQRISREAELRETADFLSQRARDMGKHLVYLPDLHASAIAWDAQSTLVSTDNIGTGSTAPRLSLVQIRDPNPRHVTPVQAGPGVRQGSEWAALVARSPEGDLVWVPGLAGGNSPAHCAGMDYHEVAFNAPLTSAFAGGGLFDLTGQLMGFVARCGDKLSLIAASELASLLKMADSLDAQLWLRYGMRLTPLDDKTRDYFEETQGLLVTAVLKGGLADRAGLVPGDIVMGLNNQAVTELGDLATLAAPVTPGNLVLTIQRSGAPQNLTLPAAGQTPDSAGLEPEATPRGVALASVATGSPAQRAGLRPGDRVWQIGSVRVNSRDDLRRQLPAAGTDPVWLLYDRGPVEHGILLERP